VVYRANPETYETTYINSAIKSISGYTQEEWLGDPSSWANTIHPEDRVRVLSLLTDAKGRLKNLNLVYRVIRKDKSVGWVENRMTWEKDQRGKVVSINGVLYDITERKKMEDELKQLAVTDILTGAFNRTKFDEIMG
jgi:PAS domain S-box-containing protein